jgi:hypothetical protein
MPASFLYRRSQQSLRSDFIHIVGMAIHIAPECTNHITGIRTSEWGYDRVREVCMKKWLAVAGVVLFWVVLSGATYAAHFGKCPLCWGR